MRQALYHTLLESLIGAWSPTVQMMRGIGATGMLLPDLSGMGNHGTLTNMETTDWTTSGNLGALDYDGVDESVSLGNTPGLRVTGNLSIAAWVSDDTTPASGSAYMILAKDKDSGGRAYVLDLHNDPGGTYGTSGVVFRYFINGGSATQGNGTNIICSDVTVSLNTWYHVCGTYSTAGILNIYVNGKQAHVTTTGHATSINDATTANARIGAREYAGYLNYMDGKIDDCMMFSRTLTAEQVYGLYQLGRGGWYQLRRVPAARRQVAAPAGQNNAAWWFAAMRRI
jgi:hypothetical protein